MDDALMRAMEVVHTFVHGEGDIETTLGQIAELSVDAVGADMAGLTIRDGPTGPTTVVYTDKMVPEIDQAQYEQDHGPCLDAARSGTVFEVEDAQTETRWPAFAAAAAEHGIQSTLSVPVIVASDGLGALNFYAGKPSFFDDDARRLAVLFAGQCAVTSQYWSAANASMNLAAAMESRAVIDQAKGVIMATTHCSAEEAFDLLRIQSQRENRKLRDIAAEVVNRQNRQAGQAEKWALNLDTRLFHSGQAEADDER